MSHNLVLAGHGCCWQTPTHITKQLLEGLKPGTCIDQDIEVIEKLRTWVHSVSDPNLTIQEMKNPYKVRERQRHIKEIDELCDSMVSYIKQNNTPNKRLTGSN